MSRKSPSAASSPPPYPTDAELAILRILWQQRGASSVREVLDELNAARAEPLAYTTVLRFLQIMTGKRLVVRNEGERGHVYAPAIPAERTKKQMVRDLMDRAFGGSAHELVLQALGAGKVSAAELREIRKLLNELDRKL
ncbi:MAG TPA: BlaI/MecI/CopY family transcriptional regulator [Chthoniobacteraceae bacterium]|jgi:predicted transcriptional regulator|nr:BlaI/MecI/CopY family transcriptional regulator [Chthoniobacteraceae bacterium]